jgi:hypothetical protein
MSNVALSSLVVEPLDLVYWHHECGPRCEPARSIHCELRWLRRSSAIGAPERRVELGDWQVAMLPLGLEVVQFEPAIEYEPMPDYVRERVEREGGDLTAWLIWCRYDTPQRRQIVTRWLAEDADLRARGLIP